MITSVVKRLEHELSTLDMEMIKLKSRYDGVWRAKQLAEQHEADVAREVEAIERRIPKPMTVDLADAPFNKTRKLDPTRNIVDAGPEDEFVPVPKRSVKE